MPRGDGTGPPAGGGGRGRRGRGRGREQGRCVRKEVQQVVRTGNSDQVALLPAHLENRPSRNAMPVACVDEQTCSSCGACVAACPNEAITLGDVAASVNTELCCACGICVEACPTGAITLS